MRRQELSLVRYLDKEFLRYSSLPESELSQLAPSDQGALFIQTDELIESHYDEDVVFFQSFLDPTYMAYTMAYYGEYDVDDLTIDEAQARKFDLVIERAGIKDGNNVLNVGCGFASFDRYLISKFPNVSVMGLTPSAVQCEYISSLMQNDSEFNNSFTLINGVFDYEFVSSCDLKFDVVMSIGVLEQLNNMKEFLRLVSDLLVTGGVSFHHFITSSISTPQVRLETKAIIGKYFPGGRVWPHSEFMKYQDHLTLDSDWIINGMNYHKTLTVWHKNYWGALPGLLKNGFSFEKARYWNDYFMLCRSLFASKAGDFYQVSHYLFKKR